MTSTKKIAGFSLLFIGLMTASTTALANWKWCCPDPQHAGGTAQERCDGNQVVSANKDECEAQKKKHDASTGHGSTCTPK